MSDLADKLEHNYGTPGRARQTPKQLATMWGVEDFDPKNPPERVVCVGMGDNIDVWLRIEVPTGKGQKLKTYYEKIDEA